MIADSHGHQYPLNLPGNNERGGIKTVMSDTKNIDLAFVHFI